MKTLVLGKVRVVLLILVGLLFSYRFIQQIDHDFVFDTIINNVLLVIVVLIFAWNVIKDRNDFRKSKTWRSFIPTYIGLVLGLFLLVTIFFLNLRDASPSKLYCVTKIVDFNGAAIDFRIDGTYKLTSWCLGEDIYRGTYTMHDSIITLDRNEVAQIIVSNKLLMKQDGVLDSFGSREQSIYQIDNNGQIISDATDFRLIKKPAVGK